MGEAARKLVDDQLYETGTRATAVATEPALDTPIEGLPSPCPRCGNDGYLAHIDLKRGKKHESCHGCGHWWSTPLADHAAAGDRELAFGRSTRTGLADRLQGRRVMG